MGEPVWTSIVVGGKAARKVWEKLAEMCPDENQEDIDWFAYSRGPFGSEGKMKNVSIKKMREFCTQHGLSFRINYQEPHGEVPCQVSWGPGMQHEHVCPYFTLSDLKLLFALGCTMAEVIDLLSGGEF